MLNFIKQKLKSENYRQVLLVTSLLIVSRFFGLIRQSIIGSSYITNGTIYSDMFINAQKIQDTLIALLIMGTLLSTFTPRGAKILAVEGEDTFNRYTRFNFWIFMVIYLFIAICAAIFIEDILRLSFPRFYNEYSSLGLLNSYVDSARVLCFGVVFFAANTLFQTYLNLKNSFLWNNLTGIVSNVFIIITLIISPKNFVFPVSCALVLSFFIGTIIHYFASLKMGLGWSFMNISAIRKDYNEFKGILFEDIKIIIPKIFILPLATVTSLLISLLGDNGDPTFYDNASNIQGIFLTVIGAVGMVILPKLSHSLHNEPYQVFLNKINIYIRKLLPLTIIGAILTALLARYLLIFILSASNIKRGVFSFIELKEVDYIQVYLIQILSIAIVFLAINEILIKYFLVKNQIYKLLTINTVAILVLIIISYSLINFNGLFSSVAISIGLTVATAVQSILYYTSIYFDKNKVNS
jgi:peptidoglycan biosynthesis protein MviN/MurJ (putative lipid II flippase)